VDGKDVSCLSRMKSFLGACLNFLAAALSLPLPIANIYAINNILKQESIQPIVAPRLAAVGHGP
jgi:hypothetical protein